MEQVLIIADEEGIRRMLGMSLADLGYDVHTAADRLERTCRNRFRVTNPRFLLYRSSGTGHACISEIFGGRDLRMVLCMIGHGRWNRGFRLLLFFMMAWGFLEVTMGTHLFAENNGSLISLPEYGPKDDGGFARLLHERRSVRSFAPGALTIEEVAKVLFAAQGVTRHGRYRTVPSAGALYPLEVYLVAGQVQGFAPGVYKYLPESHALRFIQPGDHRTELAKVALGQSWIARAQAVVVISAVYERVMGKYGSRGEQYVHMEAGAAAQSLSLQAAALDLGTTLVGAFDEDEVQRILGDPGDETPLLVLPLGKMK